VYAKIVIEINKNNKKGVPSPTTPIVGDKA